MEAKKNPGKDVHQQSFKFFLIGLGISVSLAIVAFEWTTEKLSPPVVTTESPMESYLAVLATTHEPMKATPVFEKRNPPSLKTFTETVTPESGSENISDIDLSPEILTLPGGDVMPTEIPEDTTNIIVFAEFQPKPTGGYEMFYSELVKNLKYPRQAIKNEVQGKVFVEFVVDRQGKISKLKVVKGIGAGCDEEAMRVIARSTWEPGKQRGRAVNVRMIMPVIFKIQ